MVTYISSNEIVVQGESFTDAISYDFKYIKSDGTETIISSANILCSSKNGEKIIISYRYNTLGELSENFTQISFFYVSVPSIMENPSVLLSDTSKIILTWNPPNDNGVSTLLDY